MNRLAIAAVVPWPYSGPAPVLAPKRPVGFAARRHDRRRDDSARRTTARLGRHAAGDAAGRSPES